MSKVLIPQLIARPPASNSDAHLVAAYLRVQNYLITALMKLRDFRKAETVFKENILLFWERPGWPSVVLFLSFFLLLFFNHLLQSFFPSFPALPILAI